MRLAPNILLIALAACAETGASEAGASPEPAKAAGVTIEDGTGSPGKCSLTVSFGSFAMGIDRGAAARIEPAILGHPGVRSVTRHRWGMEGEYTLCVQTREDADAEALFEQLRPLVPKAPRGPIKIALRDGRMFDGSGR